MELRATMELRVGRDKSTGKKGTSYIVRDKDPTVIHLPARGQRYYRAWPAVLRQGRAVVLLATMRYYRTTLWYCRDPQPGKQTQAGAVLPLARYYRALSAVLP